MAQHDAGDEESLEQVESTVTGSGHPFHHGNPVQEMPVTSGWIG